MKLFLHLMLAVCGITLIKTDKEILEPNTQDEADRLTDKLWKVIQKRLKDYGYDEEDPRNLDNELTQPQCPTHKVRNNTIIRTHDSQKAGATFISSPQVISRSQCLDECCSVEDCNIAVYKEKMDEDHACYLFDCGTPNICLFTSHPGYSVLDLPSRTTSDKALEKHENDLQNLAVETTTSTSTTSTTPAPTTTSSTTAVPEVHDPVPLFEKCQTHKDCAGSWTRCIAGECVCLEGYHEQEGHCRKKCSKFEFECLNRGQPLVYPQCIAIYNRCDGIPLCKDESDEKYCDNGYRGFAPLHNRWNQGKSSHNRPSFGWIGKGNPGHKHIPVDNDGGQSITDTDSTNGGSKSQTGDKEFTEPKVLPSKEKEKSKSTSDVKEDSRPTQEENSEESPVKTAESSSRDESQFVVKPAPSDVPDDTKEQKSGKTDDSNKATSEEAGSVILPSEETKSDKSQPIQEPAKQDADTESNSEILDMENSAFGDLSVVKLTDQEIEEKGNTLSRFYKSNRGAVVALSLGLTVTALLLIFVGCRLRNVKKRLRKGRPLNSNEADYLINGMYL